MKRDLIFISIALMTWGVGEGMFLYFEPLYLQQLGANPVQIGVILGWVGITMAAALVPAGYLSDRLGRRPLLYIAWLMGIAATWIMALSQSLTGFVVGISFYGLTSFVVVPLNSYVTAARGNWTIARALTVISASFNFGAIIGPILGGWIGEQVGLQRSFFAAAIMFMISAVMISFIRSQPIEIQSEESGASSIKTLITKRFLQYLLVIFFVMVSLYLPQPLSQNFLQNQRGISLLEIGYLISARSVGIVLINLTLGRINAKIGFILAQVGIILYALLILQGTQFYAYYFAYILLGSFQTARLLAIAQGRTLVKSYYMGLAYGMIETIMALAIIIAPPIAGLLYSRNPTWVYSISMGLISLSILVTILFLPLKYSEIQVHEREELASINPTSQS